MQSQYSKNALFGTISVKKYTFTCVFFCTFVAEFERV